MSRFCDSTNTSALLNYYLDHNGAGGCKGCSFQKTCTRAWSLFYSIIEEGERDALQAKGKD